MEDPQASKAGRINYIAGIVTFLVGLFTTATPIILDHLQNCSASNPCSTGAMFTIYWNLVIGPILLVFGFLQIRYGRNLQKSQKITQSVKPNPST